MELFAPHEIPIPEDAVAYKKRGRGPSLPRIQTIQFDLFGDDPMEAMSAIERQDEADLDITIALEINPGILATSSIDDVDEAVAALKFARYVRKSGADEQETVEALNQSGANGDEVLRQLSAAEAVIGTSEQDLVDEQELSDADLKALLGGDEDDEVAELGHSEGYGEDEPEADGRKAKREEGLASTAMSSLMRQLRAGRYEPPTEDQEKELGRKLKSEDPAVAEAARNELVERNMRFLIFSAKSFQWTKRSMPELVTFAVAGLMRAASKFDPEQGRFTTYAKAWIRRSIQDEVLKDGVFNTPRYLSTKENQLRKLAAECQDPVYAKQMLKQADQVREEINGRKGTTSLDSTPTGSDDEEGGLHNLFASEEAGPDELLERRQLLEKLIETAQGIPDQRAGEIFLMRLGLHEDFWGEPQTMPAMTEHFPLGRERIRQLYLKAAEMVCDRMEDWAQGPENLPDGFRAALKG